jgi:hypothetical protein
MFIWNKMFKIYFSKNLIYQSVYSFDETIFKCYAHLYMTLLNDFLDYFDEEIRSCLLLYLVNVIIFSDIIINVLMHCKVILFLNTILLLQKKFIFIYFYYYE